MPDEQAYQVLDYIEFLESKYSQRAAGAPAFQKVAETLEDTMRAGRVPITIIRGTMDAVGKAGRFFEGLAAAGKAAVEEAKKFFFQAEDGIRDLTVTGVQTCALPI